MWGSSKGINKHIIKYSFAVILKSKFSKYLFFNTTPELASKVCDEFLGKSRTT